MGSSEGVSPRFGILRLSYGLLVGFSCDSVLICSHSTLRLSQCGICPFQNELFIHLDLMSAVRQVVSGARCCMENGDSQDKAQHESYCSVPA